MTTNEPVRPVGEQPPAREAAPATDETVVTTTPNLSEETTHATGTVAVRRSRGGSATRWGIALAVVAIVVGVAAAAVFLVSGQSTPSTVLAYAPKDSIAYVDARLDLPGDQRQKLADFLSKFPGFADQSTLETKIDEVLDRLVKAASKDQHTWSTEIKPWFGGEVSFAVGQLPEVVAAPSDGSMPEGRGLALVSVKDETKARAWLETALKDTPHASGTYNGVDTITVGDRHKGLVAIVDGKVMLAGDEQTVQAAIDGKGQNGLSTVAKFSAAQNAIQGDGVAWYYIDTKAYADAMSKAMSQAPGADASMAAFLDRVYKERAPDWTAGRVRVESDALRIDQVNPHVDAGPKLENRVSNVVDNLPASTIAVLDAHNLGANVLDGIQLLRSYPGSAETFQQLDQQVALLGGFDSLFGWMGDSAIVVTRDGADVRGGLVIAPTDRAAAERLVNQVKAALAFASGMGISSHEETHNGTTITVIDVSGASPMPGMAIPELGIAVNDHVAIIGVGTDFVKAVLDAKPGANLADDARYKAALERVGSQNASSFWLDAAGIRDVAEQLTRQLGGEAAASDMAKYEREVKPYLEHLDAIVGASVLDGGFDRSSFVITVK